MEGVKRGGWIWIRGVDGGWLYVLRDTRLAVWAGVWAGKYIAAALALLQFRIALRGNGCERVY